MNRSKTKFGLLMAVTALFALISVSPAMAQGDLSAPGVGDDDVDEEELEQESSLPELDDDDPMYWAQMREIYTMQQRPFLKEGRIAATFYGGLIPNNIFEYYFPVGLRLNYYLMENIGLEVSSSFNFSYETHLNDIVEDEQGINAENRPLIGDSQVSHTTAGVKWSPVYGKFTFFDDNLFYFDMFAFGGAGMAVVQTQTDHGTDPSTTVKPEGVLGAGFAVYAGQHAGVRIDYRQFVFQKHEDIGGVANPSEISLGFSWFF